MRQVERYMSGFNLRMNRQTMLSPREHHFYVAIAKFIFHHPEHGIVSVQDPIKIKDAQRYGLSPLIIYGVTVAGLPIRWMTFTPVDQPRAFRDVLLDAWRNAEGLRGRPDILRVNRHLSKASPELVEEMAKIGVQDRISQQAYLPCSAEALRRLVAGGKRQHHAPFTLRPLQRNLRYRAEQLHRQKTSQGCAING
jgi:hypothetical protein